MSDIHELDIVDVASGGDGVARLDGETIFVPYTLLGERVRVEIDEASRKHGRGQLLDVVKPSPERVTPVCRHFRRCGGCALQHMDFRTYQHWKRDSVVETFRKRGIVAPVAPLIVPQGFRRRAVMAAVRGRQAVFLGYHEARSHNVVDVIECPILEPAITSSLPGLRQLLSVILEPGAESQVTVTSTNGGLDVHVTGLGIKLTPLVRARLAREAAQVSLARLSVDSDPVYEALPPALTFGTASVELPPGAFVQAMAAAEASIADIVIQSAGKAKAVADLFCGVGAFAFPLAKRAKVFAADADQLAIGSLKKAVRTAGGVKPIEARVRDLFHEPLSALELNDFDAVVYDPPRSGAKAQARMLAKSKVKTVIAISCWPPSLVEEATLLLAGGYTLEQVTPIDQFRYSPHVEAVAVFRR